MRRSTLGVRRPRTLYAREMGGALALERGLEEAKRTPGGVQKQALRTHALRLAVMLLGGLSVAILLAEGTVELAHPDLLLPSALVRGSAHGEVG